MGIIYTLVFPNGKTYVGITTRSLNRRIGEHRAMASLAEPRLAVHRAWKKFGEPEIRCLAIVENRDLAKCEQRAIIAFNSFGACGYNMTPGGDTSPAKVPQIAEKIRVAANKPDRIAKNIEVHTGRKRSAETCANISAAKKGKTLGHKQSAEHVEKRAAARRGKPRGWDISESHRLAIINANKGKPKSPETKLKMSKANRGKVVSDETKRKISEARKKYFAERKLG